MTLHDYLESKRAVVECHMEKLLDDRLDIPVIQEAMEYSLRAGGKRLRPILALMANELLGGSEEEVLPYACAIEMIHTYSLIHDDLPAMDNDDFRRGKPTNHKVYGEGFAILAGDALLNKAFEVMLDTLMRNPREGYIKAAAYISKASGVEGMIGGQCIDLYFEDKEIEVRQLDKMHEKKTGAMIKAPIVAGALIAGADEEAVLRMEEYGRLIGMAFQIADDILDVEGSAEKLGKSTGSDKNNHKATFVSFYGIEKSKELAALAVKQAQNIIDSFGEKGRLLRELAEYIITRDT